MNLVQSQVREERHPEALFRLPQWKVSLAGQLVCASPLDDERRQI